jgi:hypothetical protein
MSDCPIYYGDESSCQFCPPGPPGPQGIPGGVISFAEFYALMPPDNTAPIAPGSPVQFPNNGPTSATDITRASPSSFNLVTTGVYLVQFQASVEEPGQLVIALNGAQLPYTVVGRATGSTQIVGLSLVSATAGDVLSIINSIGNPGSLTLTPFAGSSASPVSASLVITRYS